MIDKKRRPTFAGAADLVAHAKAAARHLEDLCAQLARVATRVRHQQRCARRFEVARAMLRTGLE